MLRPDVPQDFREQAAQRLLTEARTAAKLQHPGIVRITDYGQTGGGDPYIDMERLDGLDPATHSRTRTTSVRDVRYVQPNPVGSSRASPKSMSSTSAR